MNSLHTVDEDIDISVRVLIVGVTTATTNTTTTTIVAFIFVTYSLLHKLVFYVSRYMKCPLRCFGTILFTDTIFTC
jgi:hypothetical protein